ncbi:hypothetical protein VTL71DRAFT_14044 [Oculimacula yallundae]|uniref:FAD-binding PCMH-type domain-containing protein n=1 Tax=Oculimacula yallundae TaxID=86028 RepID=A0ABR4CNW9_9HELO
MASNSEILVQHSFKASPSEGERTVELLAAAAPRCTLLRGTSQYEKARKGFWAADQAACSPFCIYQPTNAQEVSECVKILRKTGCPFAIKSGGHGRCEGESSISRGVLIDLKRLNRIELSDNKKICHVGPGNEWASVYSLLNPQGLTVIGGRASTVGVGGFVISGGISFFSNRHGWGLDNVSSFEVVLGNGDIVQADQTQHADLYKALRGGGANFGIVTSLALDVHPYKGMWGGDIKYELEHGDELVDAFLEYGRDNVRNVDASVILAFVNYKGHWVWHCDIEHLDSSAPSKQSILQKFLDIPSVSNCGPATLIERTDSMSTHYPNGVCNGYWSFCTKVDKRLIKVFMDTWREEVDQILDVGGLDNALANINIVTQNIIDAMSRKGGNALGLAGEEPLLLYLLEPLWTDRAQSHRVWKALRVTAEKTQAEADRLGLYHSYIYLNYANPYQDVYTGYGVEAKEFLLGTSRKYDPEGTFQHQRGAGWHLQGTLISTTGIDPADGVVVKGKGQKL